MQQVKSDLRCPQCGNQDIEKIVVQEKQLKCTVCENVYSGGDIHIEITAKELAEELNGYECFEEISKELSDKAKSSGLVIVFGAKSLIKFRGSIFGNRDETKIVYLTTKGWLVSPNFADTLRYNAKSIITIWNVDDYSWSLKTDIPHETFNTILKDKDNDKYSGTRGIVFHMKDLKTEELVDE